MAETHLIRRASTRREAIACFMVSLAALSGCERRMRDGTVIIGSSPTGVPLSFVDPWTNELTGSMVDTARAVFVQAARPVEMRITPFSALIPSLRAHKIDMIAAAMLRTPEREKVVAFSDSVFAYGGGLVVPKSDTREYPNLESLRTRRVGAQLGTRFIDQVAAAGVEQIVTYDNLADMLRDLSHGRIDAAYGDAPILGYQLRIGSRPSLRLVETFTAPAREELCFILRLDDPLIRVVNSAIAALRQTEIPAIIHRWRLE